MPDAVTTKVLFSGNNERVVNLTNISDGTGELNVVKVDRSAIIGPDGVNSPSKIRIDKVEWSIQGFEAIEIKWNDTLAGPADETALVLHGEGEIDFRPVGGMNPTLPGSGTSAVGDILFFTVGTTIAANDTYNITLYLRLKK